MHNEDSWVNDEPVVDLEKGELRDNEQVLSSNDGLLEEARRHEAVVLNEGTCGLGRMISKYPEDMTTGDSEPCASLMPTIAVSEPGKEPRNHSGLSSALKGISAPDYLAARNEETLAMSSIVVSGGRTCIFDGVSSNNDESSVVLSPQKAQLSRNSSSHEQCRVCQQDKDENLISLGCQCRGELGKTHRSCIDTWFRTKGSNTCEICRHVAVNVPPPQSHSSASYWVWRVDPAFRGNTAQERQRGGFSPLWVAFSILVGGLLLDILISITLGVSALPVNIIIGVIVVLGLGTALRLAVEFLQDWNVRRVVQRTNPTVHFGYNSDM
ncbi:hypothetical protein QQ045_011170 [Rhodiola kirilowii]